MFKNGWEHCIQYFATLWVLAYNRLARLKSTADDLRKASLGTEQRWWSTQEASTGRIRGMKVVAESCHWPNTWHPWLNQPIVNNQWTPLEANQLLHQKRSWLEMNTLHTRVKLTTPCLQRKPWGGLQPEARDAKNRLKKTITDQRGHYKPSQIMKWKYSPETKQARVTHERDGGETVLRHICETRVTWYKMIVFSSRCW